MGVEVKKEPFFLLQLCGVRRNFAKFQSNRLVCVPDRTDRLSSSLKPNKKKNVEASENEHNEYQG